MCSKRGVGDAARSEVRHLGVRIFLPHLAGDSEDFLNCAAAATSNKPGALPFLDPEVFSDGLEAVYRRSALCYCGLLFETRHGFDKIPGRRRDVTLDADVEAACDRLIELNKHPGLLLGKSRFTPFDLSDAVEILGADPDLEDFLETIGKTDYCSAFYLPFRDLSGALFISGVVSRERVLSAMELRLVYSYCLEVLERLQSAAPANANVAVLTTRERECLVAAAKGLTEKQSAQLLSISPFTVRTHLESCKRKLGARNKLSAIIKGLKLGEIMPADIETS